MGPSLKNVCGTGLAANNPDSREPFQLLKRKRDVRETENSPAKKAAKRKKLKISKPGDHDGLDVEQGLNTAVGKLDSHLLADYVAQRERRFGQDLTSVEIEDRHIPGTEPSCLTICVADSY